MEPNRPATSEYPPIGVEVKAVDAESTHLYGPIRYRLMRLTHPENTAAIMVDMPGSLTTDKAEQFPNA